MFRTCLQTNLGFNPFLIYEALICIPYYANLSLFTVIILNDVPYDIISKTKEMFQAELHLFIIYTFTQLNFS